mgnify:FL=1
MHAFSERLSVLFLCTGNAARSQMAEALLRHLSRGRIAVASAGTTPQAEVHPLAVAVLAERYGIDASGLRPKPVTTLSSQHFDVVITVCDQAAETCPVFPNATTRLHWSFADPAAAPAHQQRRAFELVAGELTTRLRLWLSLPQVRPRLGD